MQNKSGFMQKFNQNIVPHIILAGYSVLALFPYFSHHLQFATKLAKPFLNHR